jgi:hypothetical protein
LIAAALSKPSSSTIAVLVGRTRSEGRAVRNTK